MRGVGWVASDYLGIDQGAIISMIENHRSELMWTRDEAQSATCAAASTLAGFEGGWLDEPLAESEISPPP